jgi:hypothetical protein
MEITGMVGADLVRQLAHAPLNVLMRDERLHRGVEHGRTRG